MKCERRRKTGRCREHPKCGLTYFATDVFRIFPEFFRDAPSPSFPRQCEITRAIWKGTLPGPGAPLVGPGFLTPRPRRSPWARDIKHFWSSTSRSRVWHPIQCAGTRWSGERRKSSLMLRQEESGPTVNGAKEADTYFCG